MLRPPRPMARTARARWGPLAAGRGAAPGCGTPVHNAERISPVPNAERGPLEGPLDADGRHPSLRKLSQVVLHGDEQNTSGTSKTSQSVPSSETLTLTLTLTYGGAGPKPNPNPNPDL